MKPINTRYTFVIVFILLINSAIPVQADTGESEYRLLGVTLCIQLKDAQNILSQAGFSFASNKFTRTSGNLQEIVTLSTDTPQNDALGLVTAVEYIERGKRSPMDIGSMIEHEKRKFEALYGKPTSCEADLATVFAFSCYYGDKRKRSALLSISANRHGKNHGLAIKDCRTR